MWGSRTQGLRVLLPLQSWDQGRRSGLAILPPAPLRLFSGTKPVAFTLHNCKTDKNVYIHPGHANQSWMLCLLHGSR